MMIIGCDFHPSWQQVSWLNTETGDTGERKLVQVSGDAERFYRELRQREISVRLAWRPLEIHAGSSG